jgi:hypothetical protein
MKPTIIERDETPRPLDPKLSRYLHYRNAVSVGPNLWASQVGMGPKPRIWRATYLEARRSNFLDKWLVSTRGWVTKNSYGNFSATWIIQWSPNFMQLRGQFPSEEQANDFLRRMAGVSTDRDPLIP